MTWRHIIIAAMFTSLIGCGEQQRYEYTTPSEVADAVRRGWVPRCVPPTAKVETEQNVDTNESWGVATFADSEEPALRQHTASWTQPIANLRKPQSLRSWPEEMLPPTGISEVRSRPLFYCVGQNDFVLSIDWGQNQMFFARGTL